MSSLTAAYELTNDEGWQQRYEITVYQLGWRLGGKTSTGRGPCERIEEVGIHILQGWYDNAFRLLREVYRERREKGMEAKLAGELADAIDQQGGAFKRKDDMYRMAQANKAFAHYRW